MDELLEKYKAIVGPVAIDQLSQLAEPLKGIKITHINSTFTGGGVAEILSKLVPLTKAFNIETHWEVIQGTPEFFYCTKSLHNAIQGTRILIPPSQLQEFERVNKENAEKLRKRIDESDVVVVHDPQPIALISHFKDRKAKWVWRCHIDASKPFWPAWKYIAQFASQYDASIFSLVEFAHELPCPKFIITPSIDPLSDKNVELDPKEIENTLELFGIDRTRPLLVQVSRFDRFKDPIGVIQAYRLAKKYNPKIQLVLAGGSATDDPEGEIVLREVKNAAADDPDIHILSLPSDSHKAINALQRAADIIIQKSIKEGFGLTVTEGLWKAKPVIGGNTGGIKLQLINNETGFVVNTPEGAAFRIRYLLQHPEIAREVALKGKEYVREKFLLTRNLREYLGLIHILFMKDTDRIELYNKSAYKME